ncbi:prepilin peptidase [Massilia arenosa]|uniref:Prepilin peptidase n=1 Tax=Zemynaea arenosa TaxID=2561931 RepID=A0A4Y9SWQ5_9BURK|nr:A24 family peptidase [Massilia arenosa]TFW29654.1 prepilin peptidase [Massilia arenosa]
MAVPLLFDLCLAVLLLAVAARDLLEQRIPNNYLAAGLACAALLQLVAGGPMALLQQGGAGFLVGLLSLLPFYLKRGMAGGDVKLMATVGAFTGPWLALCACLATCLLGGAVALLLSKWRGSTAGTMVYGPVIAAGTLLVLVFRPALV